MKLDIKNETYNRFLKRKELEITLEHPEESTPSMASIQHLVAKQANAAVEKTEVKEIITSRGSPTSTCLTFIWDDKTVKDLSKKEEKPAEGTQ